MAEKDEHRPRETELSPTSGGEGEGVKTGGERRDLQWLAAAVLGGALIHFGWTVPWGPFEESSRNRDRSEAAFSKLLEKYQSRSFERERSKGVFSAQMRHTVKRAVELVRSEAIAQGSRHWSRASKILCRSTRCRFDLCIPSSLKATFKEGLGRVQIAGESAWELSPLPGKGCQRYEVRFIQRPSAQRLLNLRKAE